MTTALLRRHGIRVFSGSAARAGLGARLGCLRLGLSRCIGCLPLRQHGVLLLPALVQPLLEAAFELLVVEVIPTSCSSTGSSSIRTRMRFIRPIRKSLKGFRGCPGS